MKLVCIRVSDVVAKASTLWRIMGAVCCMGPVLFAGPPGTSRPTAGPSIVEPLCAADFWRFERVLGDGAGVLEGTGSGCVARMESTASRGMAAGWKSIRFSVEPNRCYVISVEIRTEALEPTTARLTGTPYVLFWDSRLLPGGYQPIPNRLAAGESSGEAGAGLLARTLPVPDKELLAPRDSDWHTVTKTVTAPTTARTAELYLAFGAYGEYEGRYRRRESGRARGKLWIRNVLMRPSEMAAVLPATMRVSDATVQTALDTVSECFHNSSLNGMFTAGDGYALSGNIVPDLSFGLFGVRRLAHPQYIEKFRSYWQQLAAAVSPEGRLSGQRVMAQVLFPLGIDEIYSFTGDREFLERLLPVADRSFDYLKQREDPVGLIRLVEHGQWTMGQGADWVDWYSTRMEGKTFNFHQWYIRALRRCAELHSELASQSKQEAAAAHTRRAAEYRERANRVEASLRKLYWKGSYFVTNIDYGGQIADEKWLDDQVWSIRFGIATPEMAKQIWSWIDADPFVYEGVPTRWAAFDKPKHGRLTWFGRLGAGDILARYRSGDPARGYQLLQRITEIFARDRNVYEAYDMYGDIVPGTLGWGNYIEHCGGYLWAVSEGPFGTDFDSDEQAAATISPRFPVGWTSASAVYYLRGTRLHLTFARSGGRDRLTLAANGAAQPIRIRLGDGRTEVINARTGFTRSWSWVE